MRDHTSTRPALRDHLAAVDLAERQRAPLELGYQPTPKVSSLEASVDPEPNPASEAPLASSEQDATVRATIAKAHDTRRRQLAVNICLHVEGQRGRAMLSDKSAAISELIKRLLDEIYAEDDPPILRELNRDAFGGSARFDISAVEKAIGGKSDA